MGREKGEVGRSGRKMERETGRDKGERMGKGEGEKKRKTGDKKTRAQLWFYKALHVKSVAPVDRRVA